VGLVASAASIEVRADTAVAKLASKVATLVELDNDL
jgi:hypothetical protein